MSRFSYDIDDTGFDDFEYAMEDSDGGLFDQHTASREDGVSKERVAGRGSVYEKSQPLDERELLNEFGELPDEVEQIFEWVPMDETGMEEKWTTMEDAILNAEGSLTGPWEAMEDHNLYFIPWYKEYEGGRQYERYWGPNHGWEKHRHREVKKNQYWRDPEKSRLLERQKKKKQYWTNPEAAKEATRKRVAAHRARKRAEKEAQTNGTD